MSRLLKAHFVGGLSQEPARGGKDGKMECNEKRELEDRKDA